MNINNSSVFKNLEEHIKLLIMIIPVLVGA